MLKYVLCGLLFTISAFFLIRYFTVLHFLAASSSDAIYKNIYINGVAVGGLLPAQANKTLEEAAGLDKQFIRFIYNDSLIYSWSFADFGARYDFRPLIEEAYMHGRTGTRRERYAILRSLESHPHEISGQAHYSYDEAMIPKRLDVVRAQASTLPVNASMHKSEGLFVIEEGTAGRTPDMQVATKQLREILSTRENNNIILEMHSIAPQYRAEHFAAAQSLIGSYYTAYPGGDEIPRSINIRLSASLINNSVLLPGEIFSTRDAVGPCTAEQGYAMAAVIVDGQLVEDYGGGICQVASTLYNALLFAELPVTERTNHSLKVYYMDFGFDAAIAGDYMDLKFKNNTDFPILIAADARDGRLAIHIYGRETRPANRSLAFVSELIEVIPPEPQKVLLDENLPSGHVLVSTEPQDGFKYELFRIVFIDGEQVSRERVNTSVYRPIRGVVVKGP